MFLSKVCFVLVALLGLSVFGGSAQNFYTTGDYEYAGSEASTKVYDFDDVAVVCTTGLGCSRGQEKVSPAATPSTPAKASRLPLCKAKPKADGPTAEAQKHLGPCYVSETKAAKLSAQLTSLVQALSADGDHQQGEESRIKTPVGENEGLKTICSSSRINQVTQDLSEVASQLWSLANRLRNVSESEVQELNEKTVDLIRRLQEIQVFAGPRLTSDAVLLQSFEAQVELMESNFNSTLALLKLQRPVRPPIVLKPRPPTTPGKSKHSNDPIVAMYAGSLSNFDRTLEFIQGKSLLEQQILGYVALYKELVKHSQLDTFELTKLAAQVQRVKDQLTSGVPREALSKLMQLTEVLRPVLKFFTGTLSCRVTNVALNLDLVAYGSGWPEYAGLRGPGIKISLKALNDGPLVRIFVGNMRIYYAADSSTHDSSRRYILKNSDEFTTRLLSSPSTGFTEWKLVPVNGGQHFKILNARYNEVVFADSTLTYEGYRRVFLKRHDYSGSVDMPVNGDLWSINCS